MNYLQCGQLRYNVEGHNRRVFSKLLSKSMATDPLTLPKQWAIYVTAGVPKVQPIPHLVWCCAMRSLDHLALTSQSREQLTLLIHSSTIFYINLFRAESHLPNACIINYRRNTKGQGSNCKFHATRKRQDPRKAPETSKAQLPPTQHGAVLSRPPLHSHKLHELLPRLASIKN